MKLGSYSPNLWCFLPLFFLAEYLLILSNRFKYLVEPSPPSKWQTGNKGDIVLIPGLHESWVSLEAIADRLNKIGYRIHVINDTGKNTLSVLSYCKKISQYISSHDLWDVILVTHSRGGIVALYLLKNRDISTRISRLVTIACPFSGSILASLLPSSRELLPSSPLIQNATEGVELTKIFNIYPRLDNHVIPYCSLILAGAQNKQINIAGHTRILEAEETARAIMAQL